MIDFNLLESDIQLAEDECCIIFDFGCYFPYSNPEILTFGFSLGEEQFDDYKINHRYPNRYYQTISKKSGRKVSKLGYPYIMKLDEQGPMRLCIKVGLKEQYISLIFPINTTMTKEKPICALSLHYNFDENKFSFISYGKVDNGWAMHRWYSHDIEDNKKCENDKVLNKPHKGEAGSLTLIYEDVIEIIPLPLKK